MPQNSIRSVRPILRSDYAWLAASIIFSIAALSGTAIEPLRLGFLSPLSLSETSPRKALPPAHRYAFPSLADVGRYVDEVEANRDIEHAFELEPLSSIGWIHVPAIHQPQFTQQYWEQILKTCRVPGRADRYVPIFKQTFEKHGIPPELIWISEVESLMDPRARSSVGALGTFQFMPETAKRFGLKLEPYDERYDPTKSAEAAAKYLRTLYRQFESWPLAIAAYNAGEGRVSRNLKAAKGSTFDDVSWYLPTETRKYVPRVLATVSAREEMDPAKLPGIRR